MIWQKLGNIFVSNNHCEWMVSHASNTVAIHLEDDIFRVYFSCRDENSRAHITYVDVEINPPFRILKIANKPVLRPGEIGTFDDSGVSLSCITWVNKKLFMYYLGWNLGVTVPWRNAIGLAVYDEQTETFQRVSQAPLLDRHHVDPFSISYPFVLEDQGIYRMWY